MGQVDLARALALLEHPLRQRVVGRAALTLEVKGPAGDPELLLNAQTYGLRVDREALGDVVLSVRDPRGQPLAVRLDARVYGQDSQLALDSPVVIGRWLRRAADSGRADGGPVRAAGVDAAAVAGGGDRAAPAASRRRWPDTSPPGRICAARCATCGASWTWTSRDLRNASIPPTSGSLRLRLGDGARRGRGRPPAPVPEAAADRRPGGQAGRAGAAAAGPAAPGHRAGRGRWAGGAAGGAAGGLAVRRRPRRPAHPARPSARAAERARHGQRAGGEARRPGGRCPDGQPAAGRRRGEPGLPGPALPAGRAGHVGQRRPAATGAAGEGRPVAGRAGEGAAGPGGAHRGAAVLAGAGPAGAVGAERYGAGGGGAAGRRGPFRRDRGHAPAGRSAVLEGRPAAAGWPG